MSRRKIPTETKPVNALNVPHFNQPGGEGKCAIYALWDIIHYLSNHHPKDWVNLNTEGLDIEEIEEEITVRDGSGWVSRDEEIYALSEKIGKPNLELHEHEERNPTSQDLFQTIEKNLDDDLPIIVIVDIHRLNDPSSNRVPEMHAIVVTGYNDTQYTINDPWNGSQAHIRKQHLADCWDFRLNRYIEIDIPEQTDLSGLVEGDENENQN